MQVIIILNIITHISRLYYLYRILKFLVAHIIYDWLQIKRD